VRVVASEEIESALREFADDDLFTFVEAGDSLAPTALLHLAEATSANPDFVLIYSDEDITDPASGLRALPFMKGGWSPDLALARDYVSRLALIRRERLTSASVDRASVYETTLKAGLSGSGPVVHLPFVLYHRAADKGRAPLEAGEVLQAAIKSVPALNSATIVQDQEGRSRIEWPVPDPEPRVSLIVPTRDRADLLRVCVGGFLHEGRDPIQFLFETGHEVARAIFKEDHEAEGEKHKQQRPKQSADETHARTLTYSPPTVNDRVRTHSPERARHASVANARALARLERTIPGLGGADPARVR